MDKVGADFMMNVNSIRERLGVPPVAIQYPVGEEEHHKGVVDLIKMKAAIFDEESKGQKYEWVEIPANLRAKCQEFREKMIEAWPMSTTPSWRSSSTASRRDHRGGDALRRMHDVCSSRHLRIGVQEQGRPADARRRRQLPAFAARYPPVKGINPTTTKKKSARRMTRFVQRLRLQDHQRPARNPRSSASTGNVLSGTMVEPDARKARAHRSNSACTPTSEELPRPIYAAVGKDTRTGDTPMTRTPIILEKMIFPAVISIAIEPKTKADVEKLGIGLQKLAAEDPSFRIHTDESRGRRSSAAWVSSTSTSSGPPEARVQGRVNVGKPEVAYREATQEGPCEYKYAKSPGSRQPATSSWRSAGRAR